MLTLGNFVWWKCAKEYPDIFKENKQNIVQHFLKHPSDADKNLVQAISKDIN